VFEQLGVSAVRRTVAASCAGFLVTVAVLAVPSLRFAYRSHGAHLVLETTVTLVAALVALLVYGRYRRDGGLSELLLVYAMTLLSLTALFLVTLPALVAEESGRAASSWAALVVRLVAGLLVAAAALVPAQRVHRVARPWREVAVVVVAVAVLATVVLVLASQWPDTVAVAVRAEDSGRPSWDSHPAVLVAQLVNLACYAVAAVAFTRRAAGSGDELLGWLGAACALAAWARVDYLLFPSLYTDWVYAGDLLRLGFYVLLLVGAVREIRAYWEGQAALAVARERQRLARDLHDGVVQELGWIRSAVDRGAPADAVSAAADRALAEARRALTTLTESSDESLAVVVGRVASEVGDRYDVPIRLALDESAEVPSAHREDLVRLAREAVVNAARHSGSPTVQVTLSHRRLTVGDDGGGFDPAYGRPGGFGLTSMRERADAIGAALTISSAPGHGTCVEVTW
jgi:signal transduction histidine kinase